MLAIASRNRGLSLALQWLCDPHRQKDCFGETPKAARETRALPGDQTGPAIVRWHRIVMPNREDGEGSRCACFKVLLRDLSTSLGMTVRCCRNDRTHIRAGILDAD